MPAIDYERRIFREFNKQADPILEEIDTRYVALAVFLLAELRSTRIEERRVSSDASRYLEEMTSGLVGLVYTGVEGGVVNGMAETLYAKTSKWSMEDARNYLDGTLPDNMLGGTMPRPNYLQASQIALEEMARERLKGKLLPETAKDVIIRNGLQKEQTRALFEDTFQDLLFATNNTDDRIKKVIREISAEVLQREGLLAQNNVALAKSLEQRLTQDALLKRLTQDGLVGIVDRGGKRWRLDSYSKMVVNTKITEAHLQASMNLSRQLGMDLALISTHNAEDACNGWEGVVVSLHGETKGYPILSDAIATNELFHPNCKHYISVINSLEDLSKHEQAIHKRKVGAVAEPEKRPYRRKH